MKFTKRILVAVLTLALLASALVFSSFAEDNTREYEFRVAEFDKIEQILEYYTFENYVNDTYEDGTWNEDVINTSGSRKPTYEAVDNPDGEGKALSVILPRSRSGLGYKLDAPVGEKLTENFVLTSSIYFTEAASKGVEFKVNVGTQSELDASSRYFDIFKINTKDGVVNYSEWNAETQMFSALSATCEGWTLESGVWYDILVIFNTGDDYYSIKVTSGENTVFESGKLGITGATGIAGFNVAATGTANNSAVVCYFDDIAIYEGTTTRVASEKDEKTRLTVEDLMNFYNEEGTDEATKLRIADVFHTIYSLDESEYDITIKEAFPETVAQMNKSIVKEFLLRVETFDSSLPYSDRASSLAYIAEYEAKIPSDDDIATAPGVDAAIAADAVAKRAEFAAAVDTFEEVTEHSVNLIDFFENVYDNENTDYTQIRVWVAELFDLYVEDNEEYADVDSAVYPYQTRFYSSFDKTYPEIDGAVAAYDELVTKFTEISYLVESFIFGVEVIENATTFGPLYEAYVVANDIYNSGEIHPGLDNETHETLMAKIDIYLESEETILAKMFECEYFKATVVEASLSSYYTVLNDAIAMADEAYAVYEDYTADYEGMAEAVELYGELKDKLAKIISDADAYIAAVNEIATKGESFNEKKAAVEKALALKDAGDVLGYEGVREANLTLSAAKSNVDFRESNSVNLIALVEEIAATESISVRRELLKKAAYAVQNADVDYEGVTDAQAKYDTEMDRFLADVKAANDAIASANGSAAAITAAVAGAEIFN